MRVNKKKMAAAGISVLLASGLLVGSVEYASHTFALSKAAAAGNTKTVTESVNTKAAKKADASKVSKEETVYVTMDANGKKDEVIVSDWLKNAGINGKISDVSDLKDIQNTKGNEKFTQDDSTLTSLHYRLVCDCNLCLFVKDMDLLSIQSKFNNITCSCCCSRIHSCCHA